MNRVTFDSATLADAVQKAARIAPSKGSAYDKAAGIFFEYKHPATVLIMKATNLDSTYTQKLTMLDPKVEGDFTWRIPSALLAGLMSNLPLGAGKQITFIDKGDDSSIRIKQDTMMVKLAMITGDYPVIRSFDSASMAEANDFAHKVEQVTWACARDDSMYSGVHIDGDSLIGCDKTVAAIVPCKVPIANPITVPLWALSSILRQATDVRLAATDTKLNIQLDAESQATTSIFSGKYPNVKALLRDNYTGEIKIPRQPFLEALNRMLVVARSERLPTVKLSFNGSGLVKNITMDLEVPDTGRIQDSVDAEGTFDDFEIWFTPGYIIGAMEQAKDELVTVKYGHPDPAKATLSPVLVADAKDYQALVTPRKP